MNLSKRRLAAAVLGLAAMAVVPARADPVTVQEMGVGAYEIVNMTSTTLGTWWVYACSINLQVNGVDTQGFCIDPWHWSIDGPQVYNSEILSNGPKPPGPMGVDAALKVEQLWNQYYSPSMSNSDAAGLQISIWELVSASVSANTGGASYFTLNSGDDYGASSMIAWVDSHPDAVAANLDAVTGPGQDYVVSASVVPQPPSTTLTAKATAYTGSPFPVTSTANAPDNNLTLHSVEWLSPEGVWTVDSAAVSGGASDRSVGINFSETGTWTVRSGASVDNGTTWVYSPNVQVSVVPGTTSYTLQTMAVPNANVLKWYAPSPVVQKTYQVKHVNM